MRLFVKVLWPAAAVGGTILMLWLASIHLALAWMALVGIGVLVIGGILLLARSVLRDPFAVLAKPGPRRMGVETHSHRTADTAADAS